jgi:hypothetical protein
MPRRLPSSALDLQTQLTAAGTGAVLASNWYIGSSGLGAGATGAGQVVGTLNGPLTGTADSAKVLTPGKALNGTTFTGADAITVPLNTTSITTSGTFYPTFVPSNTAGNQQASTNTSLSYDPNTGYLSATRFVGSGAGLTGVVKGITFNSTAVSLDANGVASFSSPTPPAQVQSDWNQATTTAADFIKNKPTIPAAQVQSDWNQATTGAIDFIKNKPTLFDGAYSSLSGKPTIPSDVSSLFQDTSMYGNNGVSYGMGAVPGYTYTYSSGIVDDYVYFNVPRGGNWVFTTLSILFKGDRIGCSGYIYPSGNIIGVFEINATGVGWTPIATKWWGSDQVNSIIGLGDVRYVGTRGSYYGGAVGIAADGNDATTWQQFEKPYNIAAGNNVRLRVLWSTGVPSYSPPSGTGSEGTTSATFSQGSITIPAVQNFDWRAYPQPISYVGGYWHMGNSVVFSAVRVG